MKIYTKKGDQGTTSLYGGSKISKDSIRIHSYGTVDELNSTLGIVLTYSVSEKGEEILKNLQNQLFVLGADLATPRSKKEKIERIGESDIQKLEDWIDELQEKLEPLTAFILPGGSPAGSFLHLARTVCRRAERFAVSLKSQETLSDNPVIYLNRLSDLLFVLARYENLEAGQTETKWTSKKK